MKQSYNLVPTQKQLPLIPPTFSLLPPAIAWPFWQTIWRCRQDEVPSTTGGGGWAVVRVTHSEEREWRASREGRRCIRKGCWPGIPCGKVVCHVAKSSSWQGHAFIWRGKIMSTSATSHRDILSTLPLKANQSKVPKLIQIEIWCSKWNKYMIRYPPKKLTLR